MLRNFGIQWHITDTCDQRCKHCYIYSSSDQSKVGSELALPELIKILDGIEEMWGTLDCGAGLTITGGDPLLHPDAHAFFEELGARAIPFSILGNPFHLDLETAQWLRSKGCKGYQMSVDGLKHTHDSIRKPGSYDATFTAFKVLSEAGIRTSVMTTVSRLNAHELPDIVRQVVDAGVNVFGFARYCPTHEDLDQMLHPLEYRQLLQDVWNVYSELVDRDTTFVLKDHLWSLFLKEEGLEVFPSTELVVDGCHCGISHLTVLADGTLYACRRFDSPVGNALMDNISDVFLSSKMEAYRDIDKIDGCGECNLLNYCRGCRAVAFGATGDYYARDTQCWKDI